MKAFRLLSLLFAACLLTACEKPDETNPPNTNPLGDKPPCYGSFKCTINGEPFQSYGTGGGCIARGLSFNTSSNYLILSGTDCRVKGYDFRNVVFDSPNVIGIGHFPITLANCGFVTVIPQAYDYNQVIAGEVIIKRLTPPL